MSSGAALDIVDAAAATNPAIAKGMTEETILEKQGPISSSSEELVGPNGEQYPTEEETKTLRKVYGKVNWVSCDISARDMFHGADEPLFR
jgi:POT family proton-dependent oligopeptide transporter